MEKGDASVPRGHCVALPEMSVWAACGSPCGHFPQHQRPGPVTGWLKYPKRWYFIALGGVPKLESPPQLGPGLCLLVWLVQLPPGSMLAPLCCSGREGLCSLLASGFARLTGH